MTFPNSLLPPRRSRAPRALRRPTPPLHPHPRAPPPPRHLRCIQPTPPSPTPPRGAFVRNFLPCSPRPLKFWKQRAKMWERAREESARKGERAKLGAGSSGSDRPARTARPEPLELGRAAPRTESFFSVLTLQTFSPSRRALRAPRAGNGRHATTRTRVCHSAHHVAVNQLANRV